MKMADLHIYEKQEIRSLRSIRPLNSDFEPNQRKLIFLVRYNGSAKMENQEKTCLRFLKPPNTDFQLNRWNYAFKPPNWIWGKWHKIRDVRSITSTYTHFEWNPSGDSRYINKSSVQNIDHINTINYWTDLKKIMGPFGINHQSNKRKFVFFLGISIN